jgi:hypothetical protein
VATGVEAEEERAEVVDGAAGAAGSEAVPAVVLELEAGLVVVVQSVGHGVAYVTEVKRCFKTSALCCVRFIREVSETVVVGVAAGCEDQ